MTIMIILKINNNDNNIRTPKLGKCQSWPTGSTILYDYLKSEKNKMKP